ADRTEWPAMVPFTDGDGAHYAVTIDKLAVGYKLVVRRSKPAPLRPTPAAPAPAAARRPALVSVPPEPATDAHDHSVEVPAPPSTSAAILGVARLLAPAVAVARAREASDITVSTGQAPRIRVDGRIEPIELVVDDGELAACVAGLRDGH